MPVNDLSMAVIKGINVIFTLLVPFGLVQVINVIVADCLNIFSLLIGL